MGGRRQFKTQHGMTLWTLPPRPPHAITGVPVETPQTRARQDATVQALREAIRINARMGKGSGQ